MPDLKFLNFVQPLIMRHAQLGPRQPPVVQIRKVIEQRLEIVLLTLLQMLMRPHTGIPRRPNKPLHRGVPPDGYLPGQPEIHKEETPLAVPHHVVGFDILVQNVGRVDSRHDLEQVDGQGCYIRQGVLLVAIQIFIQQLQLEIRAVAPFPALVNLRNSVPPLKPPQQLPLPPEHPTFLPLGSVLNLQRQGLPRIFGDHFQNGAETSLPDNIKQFVASRQYLILPQQPQEITFLLLFHQLRFLLYKFRISHLFCETKGGNGMGEL